MTKAQEIGKLAVAGCVIVGFIAVIWLIGNLTGGWQLLIAQQQTRAAEARAAALAAEADALAARREFWATGALAFATVKDSLLVTIYSLCNSFLLAAAVLALIWKRREVSEET